MKKIGLLIFSVICLSSLCAYSDCHTGNAPIKQWYTIPAQKSCDKACEKLAEKPCNKPCEKEMYTRTCPVDTFLCTNKGKEDLYKCIGLSDSQICTADKINDKYETEVLSLNEKIKCEQKKLYDMKKACTKGSEYRHTKREIRKLKKERKEICKCYEKQFKTILSDNQRRAYNKYKKN